MPTPLFCICTVHSDRPCRGLVDGKKKKEDRVNDSGGGPGNDDSLAGRDL